MDSLRGEKHEQASGYRVDPRLPLLDLARHHSHVSTLMAEFRHEGMIALGRADDEVDLLREVLRSLIEEHFGTPLEHVTKAERVAWARIRGEGRLDRTDAVMRALEA